VVMVKRPPLYTPEMVKKRLHGEVVVGFVVDARGAVTEARVIGEPNAELAAAAVAAVSRWEFDPARKDGRKVSSSMQVTVKF
jgi:TonB family protein